MTVPVCYFYPNLIAWLPQQDCAIPWWFNADLHCPGLPWAPNIHTMKIQDMGTRTGATRILYELFHEKRKESPAMVTLTPGELSAGILSAACRIPGGHCS